MEKRKRRIGDRKEGYLIRTLPPMNKVSPYIMRDRIGSSNYMKSNYEITKAEKYIQAKRNEGLKGFGMMHLILAAYVRAVSQFPGINRFIAGQKIYARSNIEIMMVIKKELKLDAMETVVKIECLPTDTVYDVFNKMNAVVDENKAQGEKSDFDAAARIFNYIPGLLLTFVMWLIRLLDYVDLLPRFLTKLSPFHGSFFITSMGSLGIPPIYHHLYDFGNVPVFVSYGIKRKVYELEKDGQVTEKRYIDYTVVSDERICDGHYFATAMKFMDQCMKNPSLLDTPPEVVAKDLD